MKLPIGKIICDDSLKVLKGRIQKASIDLIITSPPYNLGIEYENYSDDMPYNEYLLWCEKWLKLCFRVLKPDGRIAIVHYLSCGTSDFRFAPLSDLHSLSIQIGFKHHGIAIWYDRTLTKRSAWGSWLSASSPYVNSPFEGILIMYKEEWKKLQKGKTTISNTEFMESCSGIWKITPTINKRKKRHPASFPLQLAKRCIRLFSYENDIILDPFNSIGTTCVAAKVLNRKYIGIDISEKYCNISRRRLRNVRPNLFRITSKKKRGKESFGLSIKRRPK